MGDDDLPKVLRYTEISRKTPAGCSDLSVRMLGSFCFEATEVWLACFQNLKALHLELAGMEGYCLRDAPGHTVIQHGFEETVVYKGVLTELVVCSV